MMILTNHTIYESLLTLGKTVWVLLIRSRWGFMVEMVMTNDIFNSLYNNDYDDQASPLGLV